MNKALFLDRDGTIVKDIPSNDKDAPGYLLEPSQVELVDGAADAVALGRKLGFRIIVITNQSAIARGWLTEDTLKSINEKMYSMLLQENSEAKIDRLYYSPFHAEGTISEFTKESDKRKPGIGMIEDAAAEFNLDLNASYLVGDAYSDIKCAENAGIKSILVRTGYGNSTYKKCLDENLKIHFIADDILDAVKWIGHNSKQDQLN